MRAIATSKQLYLRPPEGFARGLATLLRRVPAQRDLALAAIVLAYRAGPRHVWAPLLLDLLAPALIERLRLLRPEFPVVDEEDLRQQLVLEVLHLAETLPLRDGRYVRSRLLSRTNQAVRRWLVREAKRQARQESFEARERWLARE